MKESREDKFEKEMESLYRSEQPETTKQKGISIEFSKDELLVLRNHLRRFNVMTGVQLKIANALLDI